MLRWWAKPRAYSPFLHQHFLTAILLNTMNKLTLAACICAATALTSCETVQQSADTVKIDAKVMQVPTVADLNVKTERVSATQTWKWKFFSIGEPSLAQRKKNLVYDIVEQQKADVLVEPQVRFTKKLFGERTLTISGYPATYKNFRTPSDSDLKAIRVANGVSEAPTVVVVGDSAHLAAPERTSRKNKSTFVSAVKTGQFRQDNDEALYGTQRKKEKAHLFIRGAANFSTVKNTPDFVSDRVDFGYQTGYDFTVGLIKPIGRTGVYYGPELGFASRSFSMKPHESDYYHDLSLAEGMSHGVYLSPINFGYMLRFSPKLAVEAHLGFPVSYDYLNNIYTDDCGYDSFRPVEDYYEDDMEGWDVSLKFGIGVWFNHFNIDFSVRRGFLGSFADGSKAQNLTLGIGYRF